MPQIAWPANCDDGLKCGNPLNTKGNNFFGVLASLLPKQAVAPLVFVGEYANLNGRMST
jgi:hypothetical protein